jgi:hypothetical protein
MSQLTALAPPATTDGAATVTSFASGSPDAYGRPRIWARLRRTFQQMTYSPADSGELHIRWP